MVDIENIFLIIAMLSLLIIWILNNKKKQSKDNDKIENFKELKIKKPKDAHGIVFGRKGNKVVFSPTDGSGHILCVAGTGAGKTSSLLIPTLRAFSEVNSRGKLTGTSFTIDISGDICKNCPQMPNKVMLVPELSITTPYNIFGVIDNMDDVNEQNEALEQLAFLLMPETPNMNDNARFFLNNGRKILTASFIAFYHEGLDFIEICEMVVSNNFENLFSEIYKTNNNDAIIYINSFNGANETNTAGCLQSASDACKLFAINSKIKNFLRRPNRDEKGTICEEYIEPRMIEEFNIFLIVPEPKLELYAPLMNIITSQIMQYISNREVTEDSPTVLLSLDEMSSLRLDLNLLLDSLRRFRKRKTRLLCLFQSLSDTNLMYGHDATKAMLSNFKYKILLGYMGCMDSMHMFADMIGYKDSKKKSVSKSATQSSVTESESREYIIEPAELDRLGEDMILIHPEGAGWLRLKKNFYYK